MSIPKHEVDEKPRFMSVARVAKRLDRSEEWFRTNRARLESLGFPKPHPIFGKYDREDIERYIEVSKSGAPASARRKRLPSKTDEATLIERAKRWPV